MNLFVIHYISGTAFFSGVTLIIIGIAFSFFKNKVLHFYLSGILCAWGAINIVCSATPLPLWLYILLGILFVAQLICGDREKIKKKYRVGVVAGLVVLILLALIMELPWWGSPESLRLKSSKIFVIGDSLGAGTGFKGENTWAEILAEKLKCEVINKSVGGGTAASSIKSLARIENIGKDDLVIIEIGGNDIFQGKSAKEFRKDLEKLIVDVRKRTPRILMLELPLPPFANGFGEAQRQLGSKYQVTLIPKKYFAYVLSGEASTVDGLHLANPGHCKMAEIIIRHIKTRE